MEKEEKEIDLLELGKKLWDNKKFIIKCSIIGAIVGLVIAFSIPKEYSTTVTFTTQTGKPVSNNMSTLASLAGINLASSATIDDPFSPDVYPNVISSTSFLKELINIKFHDPSISIDSISLTDYYKEYQNKAWWDYIFDIPYFILNSLKANKVSQLPSQNEYYIPIEDLRIINLIKENISYSTDKKTGLQTISYNAQTPFISAYLADYTMKALQNYIIQNRTKKAKEDLANITKLFSDAESSYFNAQHVLASYIDANRNIISASYKIEQERLQEDLMSKHTIYNQMLQHVHLSQIKVQDETPVFTIIQEAVTPIKANKPNKSLIIISFTFICLCLSALFSIRKLIIFIFSANGKQ